MSATGEEQVTVEGAPASKSPTESARRPSNQRSDEVSSGNNGKAVALGPSSSTQRDSPSTSSTTPKIEHLVQKITGGLRDMQVQMSNVEQRETQQPVLVVPVQAPNVYVPQLSVNSDCWWSVNCVLGADGRLRSTMSASAGV